MLRLGSLGQRSRLAFGDEPVPCVQCERREAGLAWGEYCSVCRREREMQAGRISRRIGIVGAMLLGFYLIWKSPNAFGPRIFAAASVLLVYMIIRRLVTRLVLEYMPKRDQKADVGANEAAVSSGKGSRGEP